MSVELGAQKFVQDQTKVTESVGQSSQSAPQNNGTSQSAPPNKQDGLLRFVSKSINETDEDFLDAELDEFSERNPKSEDINESEINRTNSDFGVRKSASVQWSIEDGNDFSDGETLTDLYSRVNASRYLVKNYRNLVCFLFLTCLYISVLYLQANTLRTFEVSSAHYVLLPPNFDFSTPYSFTGVDDVYSWINDSLIQPIWKDPVCGDGKCQRPLEFESFGFYGCFQDCGKYDKVTEITIQISTDFSSDTARESSSWNLCMTSPVSLCWFPNFQTFSDLVTNTIVNLEVPDGNWSIRVNAPYGGVMGSVQLSSVLTLNQTNTTTFLVSWGKCLGSIDNTNLGKCREVCSDTMKCLLKICENFNKKEASGFFVDCAEYCDAFPDNNPLKNMSCSDIFHSIQVNNISSFLYNVDCKLNYSAPIIHSTSKNTLSRSIFHQIFDHSSLLETDWALDLNHQYKLDDTLDSHQMKQDYVAKSNQEYGNTLNNSTIVGRSLLVASSTPTNNYSSLWNLLGFSDKERFQNMKHIVNRALFTWVKDDCLVSSALRTAMAPQFHKFFCVFFGGPPSLCNYTVTPSSKILQSDLQLFNRMKVVHAKLNIGADQQDVFSEIFLNAVESVVDLEISDVRQFSDRLRSLDNVIVSNPALGCNKGSYYVDWYMKAQLSHTIKLGDSIKWTWTDDEPHSIRLSSMGDTSSDPFEGMGSGRMLVSRQVYCTSKNVGYDNYGDAPVPCNLQNKRNPQPIFMYTKAFYQPGNYSYKCGKHGSTMSGQITVLNETSIKAQVIPKTPNQFLPSIIYMCAPGCIIGLVKNGLCNPACNVRDCAYDGGDCACATNDNGMPNCVCPSGQMRSDYGSCCPSSSIGVGLLFTFSLSQYNGYPLPIQEKGTLERYIAQHNRVLIGLIILQTRLQPKQCSNTKFLSLSKVCSDGESNESFGVNPLFLPSSSLFDPEKANSSLRLYSNFGQNYNFTFVTSNGNVPPGFLPQLMGSSYGFPYALDINLKNMEANDRLQYLIDGFFIDNRTETIDIQLITYNVLTDTFVNAEFFLNFQNGGKININYNIDAITPDIYKTKQDWIRLALEAILIVCVSFNLVSELTEFYFSWKKTGNFFAHFQSVWNYIDLASLSLLVLGMALWINFVFSQAIPFSIPPSYQLKTDLSTLPDEKELSNAINRFDAMKKMINFRSFYLAVNGINVFLMVLRILKCFHFQPKVGILTLTLAEAFPELFHFFILFSIVFTGYAVYGHLLFGSQMYLFRSLSTSFSTCFNMLLGDTSPSSMFFRFHGWKLGASIVFFWSFYIVVFFIIMNLLIAIVVDAFIDVKNKSIDSNSVPYEVFHIFKNYFFRLFSSYRTHKKVLQDLLKIGANRPRRLKNLKSLSIRKRVLKAFSDSFQDRLQDRLEKCRKKSIQLNGKNYDLDRLEFLLKRNKYKNTDPDNLPEDDLQIRDMAQVIMQEIGEKSSHPKSQKKKSEYDIILDKIKVVEELVETFRDEYRTLK